MQKATEVAPRRAMTQRQLELANLQVGACSVDRHAHLAPEAGGDREALGACRGRERTLPGERLARLHTAAQLDERARNTLRDAEPAADALGKGRDQQIAVAVHERRQVAGQIGVAQKQPARRRRALGRRERLTLAAAREAKHDRARVFRHIGRSVARAVVGHDHLRVGKAAPQRRDGLCDHRFLVARGDEDRQRLIHPASARASPAAAGRSR